jgi:chromate reductase
MALPNLLVISGALRAGSFNTKLLQAATFAFGAADVSIGDIRFPLYDGDLEQSDGIPVVVKTLHTQMQSADAIVIATPEYNGNISGVLKNALDWVSRVDPMPMGGTPVAIVAAAAGRGGGVLALNSLRLALTAFQPDLLTGPIVAVADARNAFDDDGKLIAQSYQTALDALMKKLKARI